MTPVFVLFVLAFALGASAACLGKSVCQDMWKRAVNNLVVRPAGVAAAAGAPPVELNVNIPPANQPLLTVFQTQPAANPKLLNHLEWTSFNDLLQQHIWVANQNNPNQHRIRPNTNAGLFNTARNNFLAAIILPGGPIEEAYKYLRRKGLLPTVAHLANFQATLEHIWFGHRGFQHTFIGDKWEYHDTSYKGFHSWYQFQLEQAAGRIANVNILPNAFRGTTEPPFMSRFRFLWNLYPKTAGSSMFVGTSPAFEIALYSVCFIEHPGQPCSCHIGRSTVTVQTYAVAGGPADQIATAFPTDVVIEEKRCDFHPNDRTECGWYGITQAQCEAEGCCYDPTHPNTKWCFYPRDHKCEVIDPNERKDCGHPGITRNQCINNNNCCYDSSVPNVPFCYKGNL